MAHKQALEALDRILRDLLSNQALFGDAIILLAGDSAKHCQSFLDQRKKCYLEGINFMEICEKS
jgi:PIF1 helicase.